MVLEPERSGRTPPIPAPLLSSMSARQQRVPARAATCKARWRSGRGEPPRPGPLAPSGARGRRARDREEREQHIVARAPACDAPCTTGANTALTGALLSDRERALVVLTIVLVLEDHDLIEQAVGCAQQMDITNKESGQTSGIVLAAQGVFKRYDLELVASRKVATVYGLTQLTR